jgi:hypothetical protein
MVTAALEALIGADPDADTVAQALTTIPAPDLPDALQLLVRAHGEAALPILRRCLGGRGEWQSAAAAALATLPTPEAAALLAEAEARGGTKATRTAFRRALYRLRQAGVAPPTPAPPPPVARPRFVGEQAWASALDGRGARGVWIVVLASPAGERTLLAAILSDTAGILDFSSGPIAKKRLAERLAALRADSPLPWVDLPPAWGLSLLAEASRQTLASGAALPGDLARWLGPLLLPDPPGPPPIYARLDATAIARDPTRLDRSADLLSLPELQGWFLDPAGLAADALDLFQARESRLVLSDQLKAERLAAIVDRVIDARFEPETRRRWQRRLEEEAFVLHATSRPADAGLALAAALALADPERPARHVPFVRALVERSLEIAGEVALGRIPAAEASRDPRAAVPPAS